MIRSHHLCPRSYQWDLAPLSSSSITALSSTPNPSFPLPLPPTLPTVTTRARRCAHTHTHSLIHSWLCGQSPRSFSEEPLWAFFVASKFFFPGTSKEPTIHCLYSSLGAKNFWKHFRIPEAYTVLESFIWQLIACFFSLLNMELLTQPESFQILQRLCMAKEIKEI